MNAVIGAGAAPAGDWLLVHLAPDAHDARDRARATS